MSFLSLKPFKAVSSCVTHWQRVLYNQRSPISSFVLNYKFPLRQSTIDTVTVCTKSSSKYALGASTCIYDQRRSYMRKKTLKIEPTKPLKFDYGGDLITDDYPIDLSKPKLEYDGADELEKSDEIIKKLLSLEFGDGQAKQKRRIHDIVSKVQEHSLDIRSQEVTIAYQTIAIRNQMRHVLTYRKDKAAKSLLVLRIQARRKHMKRLRNMDYEKFLWLCEQLQIKFIPVPQYNRKVSKRAALKASARNEALAIKKEKMRIFKEKLEEEKKRYMEYKEKELADIEQKLETLIIDESSRLGKVFRALKYGEVELLNEKPGPTRSRRWMILERKFALAERKAKEREAQT